MELSAVGEGVRQWIAIEQESLDRVFAEAEGKETQEAEPLPERLNEA
jgi:hypothetical protein